MWDRIDPILPKCIRCLLEHHLFPTARYHSIVESTEGPAARALLQRTSPGAIGLGNLDVVLQIFLDRVFGQGRFKVGASGSNRLLSVSVLFLSCHDLSICLLPDT